MTYPRLIVICGPTATGKSDAAVALAQKENGEVISADSRQVYRGLDIGSGKITTREMKGIPHHLLDVADPKRVYSVAQFQKQATKAITTIIKRGKTPILCGGTGFYIDAVVSGTVFPSVRANAALRKKLSGKSATELAAILKQLDSKRYRTIDTNNKVRLIRAIEIATALGSVPKVSKKKQYAVEWIYLDFPDEVLKKRIHDRLLKRMKGGMLAEVTRLHASGVSWKRLEALGLEYRYLALYLQKKMTKEAMLETLEREIWQYAKRQRTWFKKYAK